MKTVIWRQLSAEQRSNILKRPRLEKAEKIQDETLKIITQVASAGDEALLQYTEQFDKAKLSAFQVTPEEYAQALAMIKPVERQAMQLAISRIKSYHQAQIPENRAFDCGNGVICERQARAIDSVGLYVPGGTAPLVSTVMMLAIPALVAGCRQRIICTPPGITGRISPYILAAAKMCEVEKVYKVGGAQAIAAMAYGTASISKVDKIFGPGNVWVTTAKQLCAQISGVSIDLPAGPSELLVIAGAKANARFVAADLLAQAEHDVSSQILLITPCETTAQCVVDEMQKQLALLPRRAIATQALENSTVIIVDNLAVALEISNQYGPEHLSLQVEQPQQYLSSITSAGTVFVGEWAAEALGDYITGANHVLPTAGYARSLSGLSLLDFVKWLGFQRVDKTGFTLLAPHAHCLAKLEQLDGHANSLSIRLNEVRV